MPLRFVLAVLLAAATSGCSALRETTVIPSPWAVVAVHDFGAAPELLSTRSAATGGLLSSDLNDRMASTRH